LVERTINQALVSAVARLEKKGRTKKRRKTDGRGDAEREETKVVGREEEVESNISSEDQTAGPFLLRRPLTRITVASPATLKRWTPGRERRQGHLLRRWQATPSLYDFAGDQSRSA